MDKETEARLKKKIMAGEELTEEEKAYFVNYDEWKVRHDQAHKETLEGLKWSAWPILFICGFFLLTSAIRNTKYIMAVSGGVPTSTWLMAIGGWILGVGAVIGSFYMKHRANEVQKRAREANQLMLAEEPEAASSSGDSAGGGRGVAEVGGVQVETKGSVEETLSAIEAAWEAQKRANGEALLDDEETERSDTEENGNLPED